MSIVEQFNLLDSPLEGTNLIEASAGTGKTYTIAGLFLRLILEKRLSVNEILVVTFTEAATGELKDRIRSKLREAVRALSGEPTEDAFLTALVKRHESSQTALEHLKVALRTFDQAAIFTIHGFCRRMLYENAFESSSLFDTELVTEQESLKREIVDDFWRKNFCTASPLFVNYAINSKTNPDNLFALLRNRAGQPYLKIVPQVEITDSSPEEKEFQECFKEVRESWQSARVEVERILLTDEGLNRQRYGKARIRVWIQAMEDYVHSGENNPLLFEGFEKFSASEIARSSRKGHTPPAHSFFELCEELIEKQAGLQRVFEKRLLALKGELFHYVKDELSKRKEEKNIQSFDDLLLRMHRALEEEGGEELAGALRMKYRAALIDEFQDTDPIQYAIFMRIFGTQESILYYIGDPKQAIYGFRGADIFAYMAASRDVQFIFTLGENWRSEPDLITATNAIFSNADRPFVYDQIPFQPATPAAKRQPEYLSLGGKSGPPLQLWLADAGTKRKAYESIPKAVAAEISHLLSLGKSKAAILTKNPLRESDIAVLVRTNAEARMIQDALLALRIPSVLYSTGNLFDSHEALELERVLAGIAEPNSEKLLKAALSTDMIGVKGEELVRLLIDETGWEKWLVQFRAYHDRWNERGFVQMFRYLLLDEKVLTRLMALPDGERRNTNLLHLSEVLHQAEIESKLNMPRLLKWFAERRDPSTPRLEEHQLRLESDENAVKVITIHKSKGLEYPIVFCPFTWGGSRIKGAKDPFTFHDEVDNMRLTLDLGSEQMDENRLLAEKEQLAEDLRLLYVALTRAKNRCYLVWCRLERDETYAPDYLFDQPETLEEENAVSAIDEKFKSPKDDYVPRALTLILENAGGTIELSEMPTEAGEDYSPLTGKKGTLGYRQFSGNIDRQWSVSSFSSLVSGKRQSAEMADHDALSLPDVPDENAFMESLVEEEPSAIFSFLRGRLAGTLLHDIFESLDFVYKDASPMEKLVADKLREYGFEITWQETLCSMIQKVLSVPLVPGNKDFTLSHVRNQDRLNELEFYFPLKSISPSNLRSIFEGCTGPAFLADFPERIERLHFSPVKGFMKGFMDMVFRFQDRFHLVDWKSNFLGSRVEDYGQEALSSVMKEEFYILQYHIYAIALNQYLRLRLPGYSYETHFGGVYYMFLRGVDPEKGPNFGIYRDRPSGEFINQLCTNLIPQV
ncbi:exodeoxyribonuclease V subunit beta [Thermodesulfobacteriota bacterium]